MMEKKQSQSGGGGLLVFIVRICDARLLLLLFVLKDCSAGSLYLNATNSNNSGGGGALSDIMYRTVWSGYEAAVRPLCQGGSPSSTSKIVLGIALRQLQQLDEPKQILSTNLWLRVTWSECRLVWDAKKWNISRLIVPYSSIWTPDLTLYDNADSGISGLQGYRLSITSEGEVLQQVPVVLNSLCQLDVSRFPFDTQTCNLTFGSWAYHGLELNLTSSDHPVDLSSYVTHGEWEIISFTAVRIEPYFFGLPYPQVIFTLVLKRRHLFYIFSMMFPCALIQLMASLAFLLPCETNEKVGLEITVLLSLAVMQLVIMDMIPASSETLPIIGLYFTLAMIVVSVSCMMTVVVLAVHFPHRHRPLPPWALGVLRSKVAQWFGIDIAAEQESLRRQAAKAEVYRATTETPAHHRISLTNANGRVSGSVDIHPGALLNICEDSIMRKTHSEATNPHDVSTNPHDVSINPHDVSINPHDVSFDDSCISYSYTVEGERGRRHTYRPRSADACLMALCSNAGDPLNGLQGDFRRLPEHPRSQELPDTLHLPRREAWEMLERGEDLGQLGRGGKSDGKLEQTGRKEIPRVMTTPLRGGDRWEMLEQPRRENCLEIWDQQRRHDPQETLPETRQRHSEELLSQPRRGTQPDPPRKEPRSMLEQPGRERQEKPDRAQTGEEPSSRLPSEPPQELEEIMEICRKILACMKGEKKAPADPQEKLTKKMSRREWEMMAQFLDRVFLVVFTLLTVVMFTYVYASIV